MTKKKKKNDAPPPPFPPSLATNPLGAIKQVIFVRHGEHGEILDKPTPCLSEVGMGRGMMLSRYFDEGPPGVKKPTMIFAMNGSTTKATPPSVREREGEGEREGGREGRGGEGRGGGVVCVAP